MDLIPTIVATTNITLEILCDIPHFGMHSKREKHNFVVG